MTNARHEGGRPGQAQAGRACTQDNAHASLVPTPVIVLVPVAFLVVASEDGRVDCRFFPREPCRVCAERAR
ncbi:MAG: hypothetical protein ACRDTE_32270 [Pseudonocardiaceae bacterium]